MPHLLVVVLLSCLAAVSCKSSTPSSSNSSMAEDAASTDRPEIQELLKQRSLRTLVAKDKGFSVRGCESRAESITVEAPGKIDKSREPLGSAIKGWQFDVRGNNTHGIRNVREVGSRAVSFEMYAEGEGTKKTLPIIGEQCVGAEGANISVDVYVWILR